MQPARDGNGRGAELMPPRRRRRLFGFGVAIPMLLALVLCALLRPELGSALAPLLGPWAGTLYGHWDCTMANQAPEASGVLVVSGVLLGVAFVRARRRGAVVGLTGLAAIWSVAWCIAALFSVLNTTI